jgi:methyltransferase family protein
MHIEHAQNGEVYATPREVRNPAECAFYYTIEIPGYGLVEGEWDLRGNERAYLGNVAFAGKRVLQIGVANGFLSFHLEREGAEVIGYDLSDEQCWDMVPYSGHDYEERERTYKAALRKLNNAYWLAHQALKSKARMVYGSVYEIPAAIGSTDIAVYSQVLHHVRDPFLALQQGLRFAKETVVITESISDSQWVPGVVRRLPGFRWATKKARIPANVHSVVGEGLMRFVPQFWAGNKFWTWWEFNPEIIRRFIGVLGFEHSTVTFHTQRWKALTIPHFTVVGQRTSPMPQR